MTSLKRKSRRAMLGCCLAVFWPGAIAFGYPGVMAARWQQAFGVGAAETGAVVTFQLLALAVCMFFSGRIHARIGTRRCVAISTAIYVIAMLAVMNATGMGMVYAWAFLGNIACSFAYGPALATGQQWMPSRRGLASGLVNLVFGLSAAIMAPVWTVMLDTGGCGTVNRCLLACVVVTGIAAMAFAEVPDRSGLSAAESAEYRRLLAGAAGGDGGKGLAAGFTVGQALRTKAFWLIWLTWVFMGAAGISMIAIAGNYAVSLGLASFAVLTAFNLTNGFGRIAAGLLTDIIGGEMTGLVAFAATALGYLLLPRVSGLAAVSALAACVGFGLGTLFTVTGPVTSGIFGLRHFGAIFGVIFTAYGFVGGIVGPALAGVVLDRTGGDYPLVFTYLAVFAAVGAVLMLLLKKAAPATAPPAQAAPRPAGQ